MVMCQVRGRRMLVAVCVLESWRIKLKAKGMELPAAPECLLEGRSAALEGWSLHWKPEGTGNKSLKTMMKSRALLKKKKRILPFSFYFSQTTSLLVCAIPIQGRSYPTIWGPRVKHPKTQPELC